MGAKSLKVHANARRALTMGGTVVGVIVIFGLGVLVGDGRLSLPGHTLSDQTGLPATLDYSSVNQVYSVLRANYYSSLTESQILDGLKHGLAEATNDPYTEYFTPTEAKAFNGELQGTSISGIGVELDENAQGDIDVMSPLPGQPAAKAGILADDVITTINGKSTEGMSVGTAVDAIRGKQGTQVTLGILRDGSQVLTFTVTRETINVPTAMSKILPGNVGYIQVSQFSDDTYGLVQQAVQSFKKAGVKKVILDLRDDPGGIVTTAQNIASLWLPGGTVIEQERRGSTVINTLYATGDDPLNGMPTVVLMDGGSASASEITALALRDNHAATIIGEQSYGKGVVQSIIPFKDGSELKVTIAKWYGPDDENINHVGITPNQKVTLTTAEAASGDDTQLTAALNYLQSK